MNKENNKKTCEHIFRFLPAMELSKTKYTSFYCEKCLEIRIIKREFKIKINGDS